MIAVSLATEDELSEAIGESLLASARPALRADLLLRQNGAGYLRKKMKNWCEMASGGHAVLLLTDLDRESCAPTLVSAWLGKRRPPDNLVFRVAVHEVEAWLLADHVAMQHLLGKKPRLPADPDRLPDPKKYLLELAQQAARPVREDLVAARGAIAAQGLGYNTRLRAFVEQQWSPERAAQRSESLRRARARIDQLAQRLQS